MKSCHCLQQAVVIFLFYFSLFGNVVLDYYNREARDVYFYRPYESTTEKPKPPPTNVTSQPPKSGYVHENHLINNNTPVVTTVQPNGSVTPVATSVQPTPVVPTVQPNGAVTPVATSVQPTPVVPTVQPNGAVTPVATSVQPNETEKNPLVIPASPEVSQPPATNEASPPQGTPVHSNEPSTPPANKTSTTPTTPSGPNEASLPVSNPAQLVEASRPLETPVPSTKPQETLSPPNHVATPAPIPGSIDAASPPVVVIAPPNNVSQPPAGTVQSNEVSSTDPNSNVHAIQDLAKVGLAQNENADIRVHFPSEEAQNTPHTSNQQPQFNQQPQNTHHTPNPQPQPEAQDINIHDNSRTTLPPNVDNTKPPALQTNNRNQDINIHDNNSPTFTQPPPNVDNLNPTSRPTAAQQSNIPIRNPDPSPVVVGQITTRKPNVNHVDVTVTDKQQNISHQPNPGSDRQPNGNQGGNPPPKSPTHNDLAPPKPKIKPRSERDKNRILRNPDPKLKLPPRGKNI